ncbi:MAG: hypothetical protein ACSLEY_01515 [Candidatus Saccharimonadales bacterium]
MPKFYYNKFVRNRITDWHKEEGYTIEGHRLTAKELKSALISKPHEESDEISVRTEFDSEIIEEIGDVQQVLENLKHLYGIGEASLQEVVRKKREKKGDFLGGYYIGTVYMMSTEDKCTEYRLRFPKKSPEITV